MAHFTEVVVVQESRGGLMVSSLAHRYANPKVPGSNPGLD